MRSLSGILVLSTVLLAAAARPQTQPSQTAQPIELRLTGPRLIRRGDHLKFTLTITNRSDAPAALRFPRIMGDTTTQFVWRVTDTGGRLLPPHVYEGPIESYCPVTSGPSDWDIVVLAPHETMKHDYAGDPTDDFAFPGKGFYRISVKYVLDPNPRLVEAPYEVPNIDKPETYTAKEKIEMSRNMPHVEVTSNEWSMYLGD